MKARIQESTGCSELSTVQEVGLSKKNLHQSLNPLGPPVSRYRKQKELSAAARFFFFLFLKISNRLKNISNTFKSRHSGAMNPLPCFYPSHDFKDD